MQTNIKSKRGFTIVELLIVIVVIAILAAISIVAYNGIQKRGKTSSAQSLASQVQKKAEAWNTIESSYPTYTQLSSNVKTPGTPNVEGPAEAKLDNTSLVQDAASTDPADEKRVGYRSCSTGAQVEWFNATENAVKYIGLGGASSTAACS
ncbi:type II secretion system protein [Candidatus Nomurabacteria bacterium]|nr:type II secretion system protein [Candidatus Nomurabacteria bacterium]